MSAFVMEVTVGGEGLCEAAAEKPLECRVAGDIERRAHAAHPAVEAEDAVARRQHEMEIVAHEQDAAAPPLARIGNEPVEFDLPGEIDPGERLVEHEEVGIPEERPRQQQTMELPARKRPHLTVAGTRKSHLGEPCLELRTPERPGEAEKAGCRERQRRIEIEPLRCIADDDAGPAPDASPVGPGEAQEHAHERRLSGAVGSDQSHDLAAGDLDVYVFEKRPTAAMNRDVAGAKQDLPRAPVGRSSFPRLCDGGALGWRRHRKRVSAASKEGEVSFCRRTALITLASALLLPPAARGGPQLLAVASLAPVHGILAALMHGAGEPRLLIPPAASPHDYRLRPSEVRALLAADLFVWIGPELEHALSPYAERLEPARRLTLIDEPEIRRLPLDGPGAGEAAGTDPHIWLDPENGAAIARAIARRLVARDHANAERYRENLEAFVRRLRKLERELARRLEAVRAVPFLTIHPAFRYLARAFDLHFLGALTPSPEIPPTPRSLARLRARASRADARCLFLEPQAPRRVAERFAAELDLRLGELDPIGVGIPPGPEQYFELLRRNAERLRSCLAG